LIAEFLSTWPLFQNTYLSGWCIAVLLSLVGVPVVARNQIFIGAAVSQSAMLGIALGMLLGAWSGAQWLESESFLSAIGSGFAVLGALITGRARAQGESYEAVTGWVFLLSGSLSILVVAHSPHGMEEIHRLMASTIIGATEVDVEIFLALAAATAVALLLWHRPLRLLVMDREMAAAVGVPVGWCDSALSVWLGLAVGLSIRISGVAYTFGCLVLPALVAKNLCREVASMFWVAPAVAVASSAVSFVLANHYDFPPAQIAVALLCACLVAAWSARRLRAARARD
jgi:ABC-type Mn2+/Zn2+ transport system permease subunit